MAINDSNGRNRWQNESSGDDTSRFFDRDNRDQRWLGREQGREDYSIKEDHRAYGGSGIDRDRDDDYGVGRDQQYRATSDRHYDRLHRTYYGDIGQGQMSRGAQPYGQQYRQPSYSPQYGQTDYGQHNPRGFSESTHYGQSHYGQTGYGQSGFGDENPYGENRFGYGAMGYGTSGIGSDFNQDRRSVDTSHRGRGPKNFKRSDERILEAVCERLTDDHHVDASSIEVRVVDGEVILTGVVHDRRTKRRAEDIVEDLPGVRDVQNHIKVVRGDPREIAAEQLNSFLRGELSAVETYRMALEKLDKGSPARSDIETCLRSHEERIQFLREQVRRFGGEPATSSGAWGVFAKIVEGGARAFGDKAAIAALEEGEDHGLRDYKDGIEKLDLDLRSTVLDRLLAKQEETHSRMSSLKRRLSSSSS